VNIGPAITPALIRKVEDLPSDGGRTVDTIAGALLRIFTRLNALERTQALLGRRLAALEKAASVSIGQPAEFEAAQTRIPSSDAAPLRRRGRPVGSGKCAGNGRDRTPD
jgi:hypothetical protein